MQRAQKHIGMGTMAAAVLFTAWSTVAEPAGTPRYHFELASVRAKPAVKPEVAKVVTPKVEAELRKVFAEHPQLVAKLDGAPDPRANAEGYRSFLTKNRVSGAFRVSVEIKEATEKVAPTADKTGQQLEVRLVLHMVGDRIPDETIGFNGHGNATVKQEIGEKLKDQDRSETWKDVTEVVVADAMKRALEELAAGKPAGKKK